MGGHIGSFPKSSLSHNVNGTLWDKVFLSLYLNSFKVLTKGFTSMSFSFGKETGMEHGVGQPFLTNMASCLEDEPTHHEVNSMNKNCC